MSVDLSPGDLLAAKYRVVSKKGAEETGVVYEAVHVGTGLKCAVKVLWPQESFTREKMAGLLEQARAAAAVRHQNIALLMDADLLPAGNLFLVRELLEGELLRERLERKAVLGEREALAITAQILGALSAAHQTKSFHRDLKPDNVFLAQIGGAGRREVKLLDFGLAAIQGKRHLALLVSEEDFVTPAAGGYSIPPSTKGPRAVGTPGYMAPECILGLADVDGRADLFSVGVMLFEMLTGQLPFSGCDAQELMQRTLSDAVPKLSPLRPGISAPTEQVTLIALAQEPEYRFQTAQEFLDHLAAAAAGRFPERGRVCRTMIGQPSRDAGKLPISVSEPPRPMSIRPARAERSLARPAARYAPELVHLDHTPGAVPPMPQSKRGRRRSLSLRFSPFTMLFFLGLGAAIYYFVVYKKPIVSLGSADYCEREADRRTQAGAPQSVEKKPQTATAKDGKVSIYLSTTPLKARIYWAGTEMEGRPLRVSQGDVPVDVRITAHGYLEQMLRITPNHEQMIHVTLVPEGAP